LTERVVAEAQTDTGGQTGTRETASLLSPLPQAEPAESGSRPAQGRGDRIFRSVTGGCAALVLVLIVAIFVELVINSRLSIQRFGWGFLTSTTWNPVTEVFGAASSIYGTLVSTAIAMVLAVPVGLVTAVFLVELAPPRIGRVVGTGVELLAAIPSIIYGMWGLFVFAPFMAKYIDPGLRGALGFLPSFQGPINGQGMLTAGVILAIMILPFITAVTRDVFSMVPAALKESAYGMGATTWEVTRKVTVRYGFKGIIGAALLGLGRAIGETMAVTFVIGNAHRIKASLFGAGNTITSALANEFAEASEPLHLSALIELGLILFVITFAIQGVAQVWLKRVSRGMGAGL
jgi:phosphate transport system permease protein